MREIFLGLQRKVRFSDLKESTQERSSLLFLNSVTLPVMAGITAVIRPHEESWSEDNTDTLGEQSQREQKYGVNPKSPYLRTFVLNENALHYYLFTCERMYFPYCLNRVGFSDAYRQKHSF